jgi:hypothetical protein
VPGTPHLFGSEFTQPGLTAREHAWRLATLGDDMIVDYEFAEPPEAVAGSLDDRIPWRGLPANSLLYDGTP